MTTVLADQSFLSHRSHGREFTVNDAIRATNFLLRHEDGCHFATNIECSAERATEISKTFSFRVSAIFFACSVEIPPNRLKLRVAFFSNDTVACHHATELGAAYIGTILRR